MMRPFVSAKSSAKASTTRALKISSGNKKTLVSQREQGFFLPFKMVEPRRLELLTF